ncbi:MAG TPA: ABC transporter ATP-binding protein [Bauldia sp.]|nr:ABC transporter ATP-binding protein [Bauldia sp.]
MPSLSIDQVNLRFTIKGGRTVQALDDVSLTIRDREFAVIVGPSGCGKSSLLRMVAGLQHPTSGTISLDGKAVTAPGKERGMVFQSYTLFPWLTVRKNVAFGPSLAGVPEEKRLRDAEEFIRLVGLTGFEDAYPRQLSGGMMQRVALARALANDPAVLLMDEPFGALDSQTRSLMQELLLSVWEVSHKTVLFVTHDVDEAILLGDRVFVMTAQPGRIKAEVPIELERPRHLESSTSAEFIAYKRRIHALIKTEAEKAIDRG